ncbi:hypothetical protein [Caballeronia sp. LZ032]|uniref:hypothetical protein n=1 Tax=Caballeronia sp. LZ032 TaxID=3038565 RepID=UPI002865AD7A|nr:hypothetical protein [Caballeronia sp. LZ032]MDR5877225.1 hypothetical protein [Caballeronia sp. LZ032]
MNRTEYSLSLDSVICLRCNTLSRADEDMCPQCGADRQGAIFTSAAETAPAAATDEPADSPEQLDIVDLRDTHWLKRAVRRKMVTSYPSVAEPGDEPRTSARKPARTSMAVLVGGVVAGLAAGGYWYVHSDDDADPAQARPTLSAAGTIHSGDPVTDRAGDARQASLSRSRSDSTPASVPAASAAQATVGRPPATRKPDTTQALAQAGKTPGQAASAPTAVARNSVPSAMARSEVAVAATAASAPAALTAGGASSVMASAAGSSLREVAAVKPPVGATAAASAPVGAVIASTTTSAGEPVTKPSAGATSAARPSTQQVAAAKSVPGANASASAPGTPGTTSAARPSPQQVAAAKPLSTPVAPAIAATNPSSDTTNTARPAPREVAALTLLPGANTSASGPVTPATTTTTTAATAAPKPAPIVNAAKAPNTATLTARPAGPTQPEATPPKAPSIAAQTPPAQPAKPVASAPSPSIARNIIAVQQALASRDLASARKHLRTLDANQPRSPEIQQLSADLSRQERARDSAIATARTCAANKEPSCALRNARRAVSLDPRNGQAQASLRRALAVQNESNTEYFQQASGIPKPVVPAMTFDGRWSVGAHRAAAPIATDTHLTLFGWGVPTVSKGRGDAH